MIGLVSGKTMTNKQNPPINLVKSRPERRPVEIPDEAQRILHRVGLALFAFGLLDVGVMIYCLANDVSYSSSFNIFAVISGIYLWRGHPWYVKWVTRAAGFYAAAFCTFVLVVPFIFPMDLGALELRLHPAEAVLSVVVTIGVVMFLLWVYWKLRQAPVLGTYTAAGYSPGPFWAAPLCGTTVALGIGVLFVFLMHGDVQQRVIALATAKTGSGYHYFVTDLSITGNQGAAEVLVYDDQSIKRVHVKW
jgi:hypothetical protein